MNTTLVLFALAVTTSIAFCGEPTYGKGGEAFKQRMMELTGGMVEEQISENAKVILLIDKREKSGSELSEFKKSLMINYGIPSVIGVSAENAVIRIELVPQGKFSVWPAEKVAFVPAGTTAEETLSRLWKAVLCVFASNEDEQSQSGMMLAVSGMEKLGIIKIRRGSYKRACEQGWAPPPTNDYQRAIWYAGKTTKANAATNTAAIAEAPK